MRKQYLFLICIFLFTGCFEPKEESVSDGWKTSTPNSQGMNDSVLNVLSSKISAGVFGEIHSVVIVRHGYIVFEKYYRGASRNTLHPVYSVTKSVTALLIGIAKDKGNISSTQNRVLDIFNEYTNIAYNDSNKQKISLRDVLTMKAGFDWDESSTQYGTPDNPTYQLARSADWIKFMLDRKMKYVPGIHFTYNSGCTILLSGVLFKKTRLRADEFAKENLFTPLGITLWQWEMGPNNIANTGWGLHLLSRDMAKIGYLVLNNGKWNGKEILAKAWIDSATFPSTTLNGGAYSYGFQWWMKPIEHISGHTPTARDIRFAWGWGGQYIFLVPKYDLAVVATSGNYEQNEEKPIEFLEDYILKAIR